MNNQAYRNGVLYTFTDVEQAEWLASQPTDLDILNNAKLAKCKLINDATQASILAIASTDKQRNYIAKYNELLEKKFDATITAEEIGQMAYLKSVWFEIENLVTAGNAKEALVNACVTLVELEAIV